MSTQLPRVLHLISTLERAGAQVIVLDLAGSVERYHSTIAYLWGAGEALRDADLRCEVVDFSRAGRLDPLILPRLLRWIREQEFDLIHTHLVHAGVLGKMAARSLSIPVVTTRHYASHAKERSLAYRLENRMSRSADRIIAVSEAARDDLVAKGHRTERIVVIPNGVDIVGLDRLAGTAGVPGAVGAAGTVGVPEGAAETPVGPGPSRRARIGSVGRLDPTKGYDYLLDAVALLRDEGVDLDLELIGEGPEETELRARADRKQLGERVRFLGAVPRAEVLATMKSWDLFVLPSRREAFGIVLIEAMAMGTPVVAARTEGTTEVISADTGRLVPPGDSAALAEEIGRLLSDPDALRGLAERARARVEERFTLRSAAEAHARLYDDILDR